MSVGGWGSRGIRLFSATTLFLATLPAVGWAAVGVGAGDLQLEVGGRVFARARSDERTQWKRDLSVPSARVGLDARFGIARAVLEAELAGGDLVKDAFIRIEPKQGLRLYAGQFKSPFLARELVSRWDLPLISRGLVDEYLTKNHQLGGRRLGAMGEIKVDAWREFEFQLGAFQGGKDELGQRLGEDLSARAAFEPWDKRLDVGINAYWAHPEEAGRLAAGVDATFHLHGLRISGEALAGQLGVGRFTSQLLLASWRMPVGEENTWAVEPLVSAEALQLSGPVTGMAAGAVVGVNLHYGERVRLQTQVEHALRPGDTRAATQLDLQVGARF